MLNQAAPSPVVSLNHAVAISMADGPQAGLDAPGRIDKANRLDKYHPMHVARGDIFKRLDRSGDAMAS